MAENPFAPSFTSLPSHTQTIKGTEIPEWMSAAGQQIMQQGMSLAESDYPAFTGARIPTYGDISGTGMSKMTPAEQEAAKMLMDTRGDYANLMGDITGEGGYLEGLGRGYTPGMVADAEAAGQEFDTYLRNYLEGDPFSIESAQPYIDTYTSAMDPAIRQIQEQTAIKEQQARDKAALAGSFGGSRLGLMEATLGSEGIQSEADLLAKAGADALGFASGRYDADRGARFDAESALRGAYETDEASRLKQIQATETAAQTQENLKNAVAQGLMTSGEAERLLDQRSADLGYADYLDQRGRGKEDLNFLLGLAQGVPYDTKTYSQQLGQSWQANPSVYGQALSALGTLGSAYMMGKRP